MLVKEIAEHRGDALQTAFATRALRAVANLIADLEQSALRSAVSAPSDLGALLQAIGSEGALDRMRQADPLAAARLRGVQARLRLLEMEGGALGATAVAELLGISRQAVDKRRRSGHLLAIDRPRHGYAYPAWQFTEGGVLAGLGACLDALRDHDAWMQLSFFLTPADALGDEAPLAVLRRGDVEGVRRAAALYGEHGAG